MKTQALLQEAVALVQSTQQEGVTLRLLGGAAVVLHCSGTPHRELGDLDAVTKRADVSRLTQVLQQRGYAPETRFNALHGDRRLIFHGSAGKLDIFVDTFDMCHKIELAGRLSIDSPSIPASDLLLTKLQVVELTERDASDLAAKPPRARQRACGSLRRSLSRRPCRPRLGPVADADHHPRAAARAAARHCRARAGAAPGAR